MICGLFAAIAACSDPASDPSPPASDVSASDADGASLDGSLKPDGTADTTLAGDAASGDDAPEIVAPPPFWTPPPGGYTVLFVDVGQGDAIVVIADDGSTLLVDGGKSPKVLAARLASLQLKGIDILVATHADSDHIGGLLAAFDAFDVLNVYWNGATKTTNVFEEFLSTAKDEGAQLLIPKVGEVIKVGSLPVTVVHPGVLTDDANNDSIVLVGGCEGARFLLTGDAEEPAEQQLLKQPTNLDIDVLKVGHHGSKSGTTDAFIAAVTPKTAIISAGLTNAYDHPDASVIDRLKKAGAEILATDTADDTDDTLMMKTDCKLPYVFTRPML